jgi:hypothetical protein
MADKTDAVLDAADQDAHQADDHAGRDQETISGEEAIRRRAYELSLGDDAGTPEDNWQRAEAELRSVDAKV